MTGRTPASVATGRRLLVRAARLIDGTGGLIERGAMLVEGARIVDTGPAAQFGTPDEAEVIETDGTLMPGMADVHVHLRSPGKPTEGPGEALELARVSYAETALRASRYAMDTLRAGFTMVRDCAAPGGVIIDLRNAIDRGYVQGPRIRACGQGLTVTGGHMDRPLFSDHVTIEGYAAPCLGPDGFREGVRLQLRRGADFIKLNTWVSWHHSETRFWRREMTDAEIAAACDEAHAQGVHVAAHVYGPEGVASSVGNGVDTVEHGHWIDAPTVELMAERGATFVPTLTVNDVHARAALANPSVPEPQKRWHRRSSEDKWETLARVREAGIRVCTGTDAGFQIEHGLWNAHELELLVRGGFTEMEAITAATSHGADLLGFDAGRLAPGRLADFVLLEGNPLADITILGHSHPKRVFRDGVEVN